MTDLAVIGLRAQSESVVKATGDLDKFSGAAKRAEGATEGFNESNMRSRTTVRAHSQTQKEFAAASQAATTATNAHSSALRSHAQASRMAAFQQRILLFQLNDVFVSLASGMPLQMVAIQQGTQIAQIYGGGQGGVATAFRQLANIITAPLRAFPLLSAGALAFGGALLSVRNSANELTDATVTFGNVVQGVFQTIGQRLWPLVEPAFSAFQMAYDWLGRITKTVVNEIINSFTAAYSDVVFVWSQLPTAFAAAAVGVVNVFITTINQMISNAVMGVNLLVNAVNNIPGVDLQQLDPSGMQFDTFENVFAQRLGRAAAERERVIAEIMSRDPVGDFFSDVEGFAVRNAQRDAAEDADGATSRSADRYRSIVQQQQQYIEGLRLEREGLFQTEQAARTMALTQELMNKAQNAGITLTQDQVQELSSLAEASAVAEMALNKTKEAIAFGREVLGSFIGDLRQGLQQGQEFWSAFADAAVNAMDKVIDKILNQLLDALFRIPSSGGSGGGFLGNLFSSILGSARGNIFHGGAVVPFAMGGVVDRPTLFPMRGGAAGMMGEAGPEAIVPLQRGAGGRLGVQAQMPPAVVHVVVTADRDGMNAFVEQTAETKVRNAAPSIAAAGAGLANKQLAEGRMDSVMSDRFGVRPQQIRRG